MEILFVLFCFKHPCQPVLQLFLVKRRNVHLAFHTSICLALIHSQQGRKKESYLKRVGYATERCTTVYRYVYHADGKDNL